MAVYALVCFAVAAVLGVTMAALYQKGKLSLNLAAAYGLFAVIGLVLLIIAAAQGLLTTIGIVAMIVFILAAGGGAILIFNHLTKHALPKPLIAIHGCIAVIAFLLLLFGAIQ